VLQGPSLLPPLDVRENVALPLLLAGADEREAGTRADDAMRLVGVADLAHQLPEELSGGQAQRVAVARVVAMRPALVLADEPTGQLDHATGAHVLDVLEAAADAVGAALVLTTHDPAVAARLVGRWTMRDGRLGQVPAVRR
jgi:putative ABC transport system ATP-binding protein